MRFGKKEKLSPYFIRPFEILERVGKVAYKLALPSSLASVHNVFHVSMLKKYIQNLSHVLSYKQLELGSDLSYEEQWILCIDCSAWLCLKYRGDSFKMILKLLKGFRTETSLFGLIRVCYVA